MSGDDMLLEASDYLLQRPGDERGLAKESGVQLESMAIS